MLTQINKESLMSALASSNFSNDDPSSGDGDRFPFVNNASQNVQNKYLEGVPFNGNTDPNFPGPFFGATGAQQQGYENEQRGAVQIMKELLRIH